MIDLSDVRFSYDGKAPALAGVSAHVNAGEFVCILGGNGSGKSTLAKHLNALLLPDQGTVTVDGMSTADAECTYLIRQTAGMVFQNPDDQLVSTLVEDDVAFGPENLGIQLPELRERVTRALADVGLAGFERKETHALSGGQKQRVAIAGVLAMNPRILILDEASAMLDPRGRAGLIRVCRELHERGFTIVMITHFMEEAAQADRVIVLESGKVVCDGSPAHVLLQEDLLRRLNLDVPFATHLSHALRNAGVAVAPTVDDDALAAEILSLAKDSLLAGAASAAGQGVPANAGDAVDGAQTDDAAVDGAAGETTDGTAADCADAVIRFENVSFTYDPSEAKRKRTPAQRQADWGNSPDSIWALSDVSFAVKSGEFLGIAGHTGSGKSTLVQHMNGILKPTRGRVMVRGLDMGDKCSEAELRGTVGVVFQYPEHQLFAETVYKDVAFGPRNLGLSDDEVDERVHRALERVGLDFDAVSQKSPFELSGGQQRRVAFAGILAMEPSVLVLDEPAAGLDPAGRRSFLQLIARLHKQEGLTVVMVSHNMDDLAAMCDRVLVMNEGCLQSAGAPSQVFLDVEGLRSIGLGATSAQSMAVKLAEGGMPIAAGKLYDMPALVELVAGVTGGDAR